jgi:WD40 repeat protein
MSDSQSQYSVFLSHDSRDKDLIEPLAYRLRDAGLFPWFDKWELVPGRRWPGGLADGLHTSDTCAVFIGPHNLGNWEAEEIDLAHTRAADDSAFRLIPVLLPGISDPFDANSFPPFLKTRTWVDFRKGFDDQRAFHNLVCGIKGIAPGPQLDSVSIVGSTMQAQDICPYRGLQVFNEEDAQFYFGRVNDIQRLVEKLKLTRFLGVLGASGSGKSSLVRAGLLPALRAGDVDGSDLWQVVPVFPPGSTPLETLVLNFAKVPGADTTGLLGILRESERALHAAVRDFLESPSQRNAGTQRVLLVVDQLEEIFTLCEKEADRSQFLANLLYAGSVPDGGCVVVATLRADFYHKCAAYPEFSAALASEQFLVSTMQRDGLLQVIHEPARAVQLEFEPGLVETIVDDVSSQPGALPLLEHALLELWKRRKNGQLTLEAYIDTGRVRGAITKRADAIYDAFNLEEQIVVKRIMLRLTQLGEGTEDTRRPASLDELITRPEDHETVARVIETLTKPEYRLLTGDEKAGVRTVEVSHEALIRGWERLRKWLDEDREGLRLHLRISERAREWKEQTLAGAGDEGLLYRGLELGRAFEWRKEHEAELNELERRFLDESETAKQRVEAEQQTREKHELETAHRLAAAERKARVRLWYLTLGLVVLVVGASALVYYFRQKNKDTTSRELAAKARERLFTNPDNPSVSVDLAKEALTISETAEAQQALREALIKAHGLKSVLPAHDPIVGAAFSPNSQQVVIASNDKNAKVWTAQVWDVTSGKMVRELKGNTDFVNSVTFSPDGQRIVTANNSDNKAKVWPVRVWTVRVWDLASGNRVQELTGRDEVVNGVAFSRDGRQIVTANNDNDAHVWTARVWELTSSRGIRALWGHANSVNSAVFSPNGQQVVTASGDKTARVWDLASGMVLELKGHADVVTSAAFSPDGKQVVTASLDKTARVWDLVSGTTVLELRGHTDFLTCANFSPNGKQVVTASLDKTARVWDLASGTTVLELRGHTDVVNSAAFSPDGKLVVTASDDKTAWVWELASRNILKLEGPTDGIANAACSPAGKWLMKAAPNRTNRFLKIRNSAISKACWKSPNA